MNNQDGMWLSCWIHISTNNSETVPLSGILPAAPFMGARHHLLEPPQRWSYRESLQYLISAVRSIDVGDKALGVRSKIATSKWRLDWFAEKSGQQHWSRQGLMPFCMVGVMQGKRQHVRVITLLVIIIINRVNTNFIIFFLGEIVFSFHWERGYTCLSVIL